MSAFGLISALDHRGETPDRQQAFDEDIWRTFGLDGAVLVTDLSGFTRTTRSHGVLHFLSVFRRFQRLCTPIMTKYGGSLMKFEVDDLIGIFERPEDAVGAAIEMITTCAELNRNLPQECQIQICAGIDHGRFLRLTDDAFGDPVNVAFKLGEDLAEPGELLLAGRVYDHCVDREFDFSKCRVDGPRTEVVGSAPIQHFSVRPRGWTDDEVISRRPSREDD